jgi:hypothetical protein
VSQPGSDTTRGLCVYADETEHSGQRCDRPATLIVAIAATGDQPREATVCGFSHARLIATAHHEGSTRITIAPIGVQVTCAGCTVAVTFAPDTFTLVDTRGQTQCDATGTAHRVEHDCEAAGTLTYVGEYGAPGIGQAWECPVCGRRWSRVSGMFWPAERGMHILTPEQCQ